jgi:hypothetical protein
MEEKIGVDEQVKTITFLIILLLVFIAGPFILFFYLEKSIEIGFYILLTFKILIGIILFYIYFKLFKFLLSKKILTGEQLKKLDEEKKEFKIKSEKKENRIPIASMTKLQYLMDEIDELNKKYYRGTVFFSSFLGFLLFSLIFGIFYMVRPTWTFKVIIMVTRDCIKNKKLGKKCRFYWRRYLDVKNKTYIYYPSFLSEPKI